MKHLKVFAAAFILFVAITAPALSQVNDCNVPLADENLLPTSKADTGQGLMITSFFSHKDVKGCIAATNLTGAPVWSYCSADHLFMTRWVPGGTILLLTNQSFTDYQVQEINLDGDVLHSYTQATANTQLAAMGQQSIIDFNHEAMRLPNGYTAVIAHNEKLVSNVPQQGSGTVDVMGDEVLVLDTNWNLVWSWNAFDWLPLSHAAPLGEKCHPCAATQNGSCCPITLASQANDWLHGNSLAYDSSDGNLVMSLRDQDWIIKIAYENGTGNGHVVWTMGLEDNQGPGGQFTMINTPDIPSPWFSHQHDVEIQATAVPSKLLQFFDNGNTRHSTDSSADSRGQVLTIDETNFTCDIYMNVDFNFYSSGYGTAQLLDNGDYWWQAGVAGGSSATYPTRSTEYLRNGYKGQREYSIEYEDTAYRSFRLTSLTGSTF